MMRKALALTLGAALFIGCLKKPGEKEKSLEDYGPQLSEAELLSKLRATAKPDFMEIQPKDYALLVHQQIVERQVYTVDKTKSVVDSIQHTEAILSVNFSTYREEWKNNQPVQPITHKSHELKWAKPAPTALARAFDAVMAKLGLRFSFFTESKASHVTPFSEMHPLRMSAAAGTESDAIVTLHNYRSSPVDLEIPLLARQQPNCGRRNPGGCDVPIRGERQMWDQILSRDGKVIQRVTWVLETSPELPYFVYESPAGPDFGYFYKQCGETFIDVQVQKAHLIDCWVLADFALASPTP